MKKLKLSLPEAWCRKQVSHGKSFLEAYSAYQKSKTPFPDIQAVLDWLPKGKAPITGPALNYLASFTGGKNDIERTLASIEQERDFVHFKLNPILTKGPIFIGKTAPRHWPQFEYLRRSVVSWRDHMGSVDPSRDKKFKEMLRLSLTVLGFPLSEDRIAQLTQEYRKYRNALKELFKEHSRHSR